MKPFGKRAVGRTSVGSCMFNGMCSMFKCTSQAQQAFPTTSILLSGGALGQQLHTPPSQRLSTTRSRSPGRIQSHSQRAL
ncbi:hypothetical protein DPEC_G00162640 [Dallia pectoralis]|uniref:Uncharacterized protein n=1 Tax=Dallia pectoralis TaxID=75939 RepID=A0ACC2GGQ8_DALPE|nr:hypothetical protein DPEC_G00162640 [Dallia pectoralis]